MGPGFFRLSLASLVVLSHLQRFTPGQTAVFLFFVLSGYWISRMWEDKYSQAQWPYATFIASRLTRLLPTFLLINGLMFLAHGLVGDHLVMTPHAWIANLLIIGYSGLGYWGVYLIPAWSLDIELQFYLLAPLILIGLASTHNRIAWIICGTAVLAGVAFFATHVGPWFSFILPYSVFFLIGIAAARFDWRPSSRLACGSLAASFAALLILLVLPTRDALIAGQNINHAVYDYNSHVCAVLALLAAPFAVATVHRRSLGWDRMAGDFSYVLYLVHWLPIWAIKSYSDNFPTLERVPYLALAAVLSYACAFVVWRYFDDPLNQARERFFKRVLRARRLHSLA